MSRAQLPADGPCSLACDPEALAAAYIPHGECAVFLCTTDGGGEIRAGGCNP
jgi:hypothetical protein